MLRFGISIIHHNYDKYKVQQIIFCIKSSWTWAYIIRTIFSNVICIKLIVPRPKSLICETILNRSLGKCWFSPTHKSILWKGGYVLVALMQVTCSFVMFVSPIGGVFLRYYNPTTTYCSWIRGLSRFSYSKVKTYEYFPFYNLIFIAVEVRLLRQFSSFNLLMVDERVSPICCSFMIWFSNDRFGCVIWTTCLVFCNRNGFSNYSNLMDIYSCLVTLQFFLPLKQS